MAMSSFSIPSAASSQQPAARSARAAAAELRCVCAATEPERAFPSAHPTGSSWPPSSPTSNGGRKGGVAELLAAENLAYISARTTDMSISVAETMEPQVLLRSYQHSRCVTLSPASCVRAAGAARDRSALCCRPVPSVELCGEEAALCTLERAMMARTTLAHRGTQVLPSAGSSQRSSDQQARSLQG